MARLGWSISALSAQKAADDAQKADGDARRAADATKEARRVLDDAFASIANRHTQAHLAISRARRILDDARRAAGFFRGRRAVGRAKMRLEAATAHLVHRQRVIKAVSGELVDALDGLANAVLDWVSCDIEAEAARTHAEVADRNLSPRARLPFLIRNQEGKCGICGEPLPTDEDEVHVDHIQPRSKGGTNRADNLQATHARCNLSKGAKWPGPPP